MARLKQPEAPRFFTDSSVVIAGVASYKGASRAILTLGELGLLQLVVSPFVFRETERNLAYDLPDSLPYFQRIRDAVRWEIVSDPSEVDARVWLTLVPPKDAPVIAAAIAAKPVRFLTLDARHFLKNPKVAERAGLTILTPGDALIEIRDFLATGYGLG